MPPLIHITALLLDIRYLVCIAVLLLLGRTANAEPSLDPGFAMPRNGSVLQAAIKVLRGNERAPGGAAQLSIAEAGREYAFYINPNTAAGNEILAQHVRLPWAQILIGDSTTLTTDIDAFHTYALVFDRDEHLARLFVDGKQLGRRQGGYPLRHPSGDLPFQDFASWGGIFWRGGGPVYFSGTRLTQCSAGACSVVAQQQGNRDPATDGWLPKESGSGMATGPANDSSALSAWRIDAVHGIQSRMELSYRASLTQSSPLTGSISGKVLALKATPSFVVSPKSSLPPNHRWSEMLAVTADADGRSDIMAIDGSAGELWLARSNEKGGFTTAQVGTLPAAGPWRSIGTIDTNGDSCSDLFFVRDTDPTIWLARSDCAGGYVLRPWTQRKFSDSNLVPGYFDGDACEDLVEIPPNLKKWRILSSHCGDLAEESTWRTKWHNSIPTTRPLHITSFDVNGDGIDDIVAIIGPQHFVYHAFSNGRSIFDIQVSGQVYHKPVAGTAPDIQGEAFSQFAVGDIDSDGTHEIIYYDDTDYRWSIYSFKNATVAGIGASWGFVLGTASYQSVVFGDFLGDGTKQVLVRGELGAEWWMLLPRQNVAESRVLHDTFPIEGDWSQVGSGDFDGDGADDLFSVERGSGTIYLALSRITELRGGVPLKIGDQTVTTDTSGSFTTVVQGDGVFQLRPENPNQTVHSYSVILASGESKVQNIMVQTPQTLPAICLGYGSQPGGFDTSHGDLEVYWQSPWGRHTACADNQILFDTDDSTLLNGACCRLPADDVLTEDVETAAIDGLCPQGFVAQGWRVAANCPTCNNKLLCRKVNSTRYILAEPTEGRYWGYGYTRALEPASVIKSTIPAAIRDAVGRVNFRQWDVDGCVGYPWGSMFVGRTSTRCADTWFAQLQYAGIPGDPPRGTPVAMFPTCSRISSVFLADPVCIP